MQVGVSILWHGVVSSLTYLSVAYVVWAPDLDAVLNMWSDVSFIQDVK